MDAHCGFYDAYGLPVTVFRSDMILAHRTYRGQLNVFDLFTRLLLSLLLTGIAPRSFYDDGGGAHFDGLPVDFTATAVTTLGARSDGYRTYNLLNPHDDGISLDTYVDWLIEAGRSPGSTTTTSGTHDSPRRCVACRSGSGSTRSCRCCTRSASRPGRWQAPSSPPTCSPPPSARPWASRTSPGR